VAVRVQMVGVRAERTKVRERTSFIHAYEKGRGFHVKHFPLKGLTWFSQQGRMKALKPADLMRR
jgi:hypothetical protein